MTDGLSPPAPPRLLVADRLAGIARAQRWMWAETFCKWTRRPLPSAHYARRLGEGQRFALRRGSWMSVLVPMVVVTQFVDVLIAQGVIHVAVTPAHRALAHGLLLFASVWMVAWAVSLRSATQHIDHVLGAHTLTLAIGFNQLCRLPLAAIAGVRAIDHKAARGNADWHDVHQLKPRDVTLLSPLDKPTLLIELAAGPNGAWWTRNGSPRPLKRWVAVYVDQPDAMRAAVVAAIAELPSSAARQP